MRSVVLAIAAVSAFGVACGKNINDQHGARTGGAPQTENGRDSMGTGGAPSRGSGDTATGGTSGEGTVSWGPSSGAMSDGGDQCAGNRVDLWLSARPPAPALPTTQTKVVSRQDCQPFSGCKTFSVVRDAATNLLIAATYDHDPATLPAFAEALGIPLDLERTCSFPPVTACYVDEVQTLYRLVIRGDTQVHLDRLSTSTIEVDGRSYKVSLGEAAGDSGTGVNPNPGVCVDAGGFWASGAIHFAMAAVNP